VTSDAVLARVLVVIVDEASGGCVCSMRCEGFFFARKKVFF
jgi:hypothetical protein